MTLPLNILASLFLVAMILSSCSNSSQSETKAEQDSVVKSVAPDTVGSIAEPLEKRIYLTANGDTTVTEQEIFLDSTSYQLIFKSYCLHDSAVIYEPYNPHVSKKLQVAIVGDNYVGQITLRKDNQVIFQREISKQDFHRPYHGTKEVYPNLMLYDIQYDFKQRDKLYFIATLVTPDTSFVETEVFALYYQMPKAGKFELPNQYPRWADNDLVVYDFKYDEVRQWKNVGFISLSQQYSKSVADNSSHHPQLSDSAGLYRKYFTISATYRKKILTTLKIAETDKLFIYNYRLDTLVSFVVKDLKLAACINVYAGEGGSYPQSEYMVGFEIGGALIKRFAIDYNYQFTFACIGKENPFVQEQMKPIIWKEVSNADFPERPMLYTRDNLYLKRYGKGKVVKTYQFVTKELEYFAQDFSTASGATEMRRVLVIDAHTQATVHDALSEQRESSSPAPLIPGGNYYHQWTGNLFVDKPPVLFGFNYVSFGCKSITFLADPVKYLEVSCDSRH